MTIYKFIAERGPDDPEDHAEVRVSFDDSTDPSLDNIVGKFTMFLNGVSFPSESIRKFIDHEMVA